MDIQKKELWLKIKEKFVVQIIFTGEEKPLRIFRKKSNYYPIPGCIVQEKKPSIKERGKIRIEVVKSADNLIDFNFLKNQIYLSLTPERFYINDIVYLAYLLFTRIIQEEGYFFIHGSSVVLGNDAIICVGPPGSGKTIVSLNLCLNHGFSRISGDRILLKREKDKILIVEGTKSDAMYPGTIERVLGRAGVKLLQHSVKDLWREKIFISKNQLKKLGVKHTKNVYLKTIYYPKVQESDFFVENLDWVKSKIKALESIAEEIRAGGSIIVSVNSLIPSFDTQKCQKERLKMIDIISEKIPQFSICGNLQEITSFILEKI